MNVDKRIGVAYDEKPVHEFIGNNLNLIIRSHTVIDDGFVFFAEKKIVKIFSVPNFAREF